jgi:hypothetical protein
MTKATTGPAALSAAGVTLSAALAADTVAAGAGSDTTGDAKALPIPAATEVANTAPIGAATTDAVAVPLADVDAVRMPYLTTRASAEFGGQGVWVDASDEEFEAAPEGLLAVPTEDQLALRR